jgi:hypothetical protein
MMAPMNVDFLEERMNEFEEFLNSVQDAKEQSIVGFEIFGTRAILSVKQDETAFADRGKHATVRIIPTIRSSNMIQCARTGLWIWERSSRGNSREHNTKPRLG